MTGTYLPGPFEIDRTTPGTTNTVATIAGQDGVAGGAGAVDAKTQRITHASDDLVVARLGEVQASPTANTVLDRLKALLTGIVLAAGSAIIGKVGIDQTTPGTTDHVSPISGQAGIDGGSGAVSAKTVRVTINTDSVVIGATNETAPASDTAASGLNGRAQRVAQRLTSLIALWYAQASTTAAQVGVLIQGAVTTSAPAYTTAQTDPLSLTTKGGLRSAMVDSSGNEFDYTVPVQMTRALLNPSDLSAAVVNIASATDTTIVAAVSGQTTRVHRLRLNVAAAQQITVKRGSTTLEVLNFTAAGFLIYDVSGRPWYTTASNETLVLTTSTSAQVNGVVDYVTSA